jgi:hypothetical protein
MMPSGGRALSLVPALALLASCADTGGDFPVADAGATDVDDSNCTEGQHRCVGLAHQECKGGLYHQVAKCVSPQVCSEKIGCAACDPALSTTCVGTKVYACSGAGTIGAYQKDCLGLQCAAGVCTNPDCSTAAKLIYVVDETYRLLSFDPSKESNPFTLIKTLSCPAGSAWPDRGGTSATPFSMSVDRSARCWILYTSGEIFWVDTTATGVCKAAPFTKGQSDFKLFGMGFVADSANSSSEKLYVARANIAGTTTADELGYISPATMKLAVVGHLGAQAEYSPELTGTGNAELYAYFPGTTSSFVARLDKAKAQVAQKWSVTAITGSIEAWAFAHWGGKYYIFVTTMEGISEVSRVLRLDPTTGKCTTFLSSSPYKIVGAGVSTCAPVID